jgi:hypothetical protein
MGRPRNPMSWNQIAEGLAEKSRKRLPQLANGIPCEHRSKPTGRCCLSEADLYAELWASSSITSELPVTRGISPEDLHAQFRPHVMTA